MEVNPQATEEQIQKRKELFAAAKAEYERNIAASEAAVAFAQALMREYELAPDEASSILEDVARGLVAHRC